MRYVFATLLCAISAMLLAFGVSSSSWDALLLGLSGIAASAGIVVRDHEALRYICATILLANAVMIVLGVISSGFSLYPLVLAALSLGAGAGILARQQWARIPTVITSVMTLGPWVAAALTAAMAHRWPEADLGTGVIALMPGLVLAAIWVWCPLTVARISTPRATAV